MGPNAAGPIGISTGLGGTVGNGVNSGEILTKNYKN